MNRNLSNLLKGVGQVEIKGRTDKIISGLQLDSRLIESDNLFAAIRGNVVDGHQYISSAIDRGSSVIICEEWPSEILEKITYVKAVNVRIVIAHIADAYFYHPSKKLKCIGVTGTNGKTTIATLLYNLSKGLGYDVGLISTIEILVKEERIPTMLTTPDVITMHRILSLMVEAGCSHVFMEVSSHAIDQHRVDGIDFDVGVFTNISHDHLDYHRTFSAYIKAKQEFFTNLSSEAVAITNVDDKNGSVMLERSVAKKIGYSLRSVTDYKAKILSEDELGTYLQINDSKLTTRLVGRFNVYNLTAVYAVAEQLDFCPDDKLLIALSALTSVKGRMEMVAHNPRVIVDYAHTPDALENVLKTIKGSIGNCYIITVVGCGGDRDKSKRPIMRQVACRYSDRVILTSDNPRTEPAEKIIDDMMVGASSEESRKIIKITDRKSAIQSAIAMANAKDVVLIAGKGHEQYQEINKERFFFSDQKIVKDILSKDI